MYDDAYQSELICTVCVQMGGICAFLASSATMRLCCPTNTRPRRNLPLHLIGTTGVRCVLFPRRTW